MNIQEIDFHTQRPSFTPVEWANLRVMFARQTHELSSLTAASVASSAFSISALMAPDKWWISMPAFFCLAWFGTRPSAKALQREEGELQRLNALCEQAYSEKISKEMSGRAV